MQWSCLSRGGLAALTAASLIGLTTPAVAELKPGGKLDKSNCQEAKGLLPEHVMEKFCDGKYTAEIIEVTDEQFQYSAKFKAASEANAGKYYVTDDGYMYETATKTWPKFWYGFPFPKVDPADPKAANKIMYNHQMARSQFDDVYWFLAVKWATPTGFDRSVEFGAYATWNIGRHSGPAEDPDTCYLKDIIFGVAPYDVVGVSTLEWWHTDPEKWQSIWAFVPTIRRVRRLTAAARYARRERPRRLVLGAGAAVGILLAAAGALAPTTGDFAGDVIARVNGKAITSHDLTLALGRLTAEGQVSQSSIERQEALNFLIDQELLIQRGVEIGLLDSDRAVRKVLAMAMIDAVVAEVLQKEPTEEELRAFYASHQRVFTVPACVHVQHIAFSGDGDLIRARAQAEQALTAIARGMSFADARERYGDKDNVPVPDAPVPLQVLHRHFGPELTKATLTMSAGEISRPLSSPSGYHLLRIVELQPEYVQPYEAVRREVKAEYFRRGRDQALQSYLERLQAEATIVLSPQAPIKKPGTGDAHG